MEQIPAVQLCVAGKARLLQKRSATEFLEMGHPKASREGKAQW